MANMEKWHLNKEVSFSNLLTTIISLLAIVGWVFTLQGRVSVLESRQEKMETMIIQRLDTIANRQYDHLSREHAND